MLRTSWSHRPAESDKVTQAAHEYGPYALAMVAVICVELALISAALAAIGSAWAWLAVAVTVLTGVSTWRARVCLRAMIRPTN